MSHGVVVKCWKFIRGPYFYMFFVHIISHLVSPFFSAHFFRWNNFNEIARMRKIVKRVIFWCINKKSASNINFLWSLKNEVRKNCTEHHYDRVILYSFHHDLVYCIGESRRPFHIFSGCCGGIVDQTDNWCSDYCSMCWYVCTSV